MVWIPKDFPLELSFCAEWLPTNLLSWVTSQGHAEEQSMAVTTKVWLGQVTNFSVQHFSFKRYRTNNNNKHPEIFIGTCILDHFLLASLCRLLGKREIPPEESQHLELRVPSREEDDGESSPCSSWASSMPWASLLNILSQYSQYSATS